MEKNIFEMFRNQVACKGEATALRRKRDGRWEDISWRQWNETSTALARGLIELGLQAGDRVCIICNNRPEWVFVDFAVLGVQAFLNALGSTQESPPWHLALMIGVFPPLALAILDPRTREPSAHLANAGKGADLRYHLSTVDVP